MAEGLTLTRAAGVLAIRLDRPEKLNALTPEMLRNLAKAVAAAQTDADVRVVVLSGSGKAFCSGMDVAVQAENLPQGAHDAVQSPRAHQQTISLMLAVVRAFLGLHKPLIAEIGGVVAGAGFSLALLCDLRIASEAASFANVYLRRALVPDLGLTYLLPAVLGYSQACELTFTGARIGAAEALRLGLVNQMVSAAELPDAVSRIAEQITRAAPLAASLTKQLFASRRESELYEAVQEEAEAQARCTATTDYREGIAAFQEKREPRFCGR